MLDAAGACETLAKYCLFFFLLTLFLSLTLFRLAEDPPLPPLDHYSEDFAALVGSW